MNDIFRSKDVTSAENVDDASDYTGDFWRKENLNFSQPWYRLEKSARIINKLSRGRDCSLLDIGCGPATLGRMLPPNICYHGIDIAVHQASPNLIEANIIETPISFRDKKFDLIVAQGIFEYLGDVQSQKFAEISRMMNDTGRFIVSYWNFGHRKPRIYPAFSNIQSIDEFRKGLSQHFTVDRFFPTSYNWGHGEPRRRLIKAVNLRVNMNIPFISPALAVEYFFICSSSRSST